jgi:hypothetical protein
MKCELTLLILELLEAGCEVEMKENLKLEDYDDRLVE